MNYKNFIIGILFLIVPIVLLYMCSVNFKLKNIFKNESFKNVIRKKAVQDKNWRKLKFFQPNIDNSKPAYIATDPVHKQKNVRGIPIQIENFKYDKWQNLKYFHPKNIDMNEEYPSLVATAPVHKKIQGEKQLIEGFLGNFKDKVSNLFSTPNSKINLEAENHSIKALKNNDLDNTENLKKLKEARSELLKLENNQLGKQFSNNLDSSNQNLNKKIEKRTMKDLNKGMPMINAKPQSSVPIKPKKPLFDIKSLDCQFFSDSCPNGYQENGFFSVGGTSADGLTLTCGNAASTKNGEAVAQIRDESINRIIITDAGSGYLPNNPPKVEIISRKGKGSGATAEAVVGDDGMLKLIKVLNSGQNYIETPEVKLAHPNMNRSCHMCCRIK